LTIIVASLLPRMRARGLFASRMLRNPVPEDREADTP
jgi:hypothetical protein